MAVEQGDELTVAVLEGPACRVRGGQRFVLHGECSGWANWESRAMTSAKTVLVPLDGSVHATAAIPVARGFGELLHATVALLHVSDDALTPAALIERMKLSGEDVPGLIVEHRPGAAAAAIVKEAGERHAAMIVMCPQIRTDLPVARAWQRGSSRSPYSALPRCPRPSGSGTQAMGAASAARPA